LLRMNCLTGQAVLHRRAHLLHVHQPRCLTGHVDHQRVGMGDLHTDGGRRAVAHGAQAAGGHPAVGILEAQELRGPHLVLADLGADVAVVVLGQGFQPFQCVLRFDGRFGVRVAQAVHRAPGLDLLPPGLHGGGVRLAAARLPDAQHVLQHMGPTSPMIGKSAWITLLIEDGSMSIWPCGSSGRNRRCAR
jgi:hypothetical protein